MPKRDLQNTPGVNKLPLATRTPEYQRLDAIVDTNRQALLNAYSQRRQRDETYYRALLDNWYKFGIAPTGFAMLGNVAKNLYNDITNRGDVGKARKAYHDSTAARAAYLNNYRRNK